MGMRKLREQLFALDPATRAEFFKSMTEAEALAIQYSWDFWARPDQVIPPALEDGTKSCWLIKPGRGWGKTRTGAETVNHWARTDPGCRIAFIAANPEDARKVMVDGESGVLECSPPWFMPVYNPSLKQLTWPNGSTGHLYSAEKPSSLRGPQHHYYWGDEWAKFRFPEETWLQLIAGLRLGQRPRGVITTTPRPIPFIKTRVESPRTITVHGSTFDNSANLPQSFLEDLKEAYAGTTLERQELYGDMLEEVAGALWTWAVLNRWRVRLDPETLEPEVPGIVKRIMAIDPSVSSTKKSDETGAVVVALGEDGIAYVEEDLSGPGGLDKHAERLVRRGVELGVDTYVGEANNGGDLVGHTLKTVRLDGKPVGRGINYRKVHASQGKRTRAEPVALLSQQGRVRMVGNHVDLESQLCTWDAGDPGLKSPDRLDALVWAVTHLLVTPKYAKIRVRRMTGTGA